MPNRPKRDGRDLQGRFVKGNPGSPGRPPVAVERKYLETMHSVVTDADWKAITERAIVDAKDGLPAARDWLSKYLVADPTKVKVEVSGGLCSTSTHFDLAAIAAILASPDGRELALRALELRDVRATLSGGPGDARLPGPLDARPAPPAPQPPTP